MKARILELLQRPEEISAEDIALLQKEVSAYPYMQSLRTLQLSVVYHFDGENYQKELTKTAAYTTDKKILYQFINKKKIEEKREAERLKIKALAEEKEAIDTSTSGTQIEQEVLRVIAENEPVSDAFFKTRKEDLNYTKETILDQFDQVVGEENDTPAVKPSDISFNGFDSFLPDVKFTIPSAKSATEILPESPIQDPVIQEEPTKEKISFENVQPFEVEETPVVENVQAQNIVEVKIIEQPVIEKAPVEVVPEPEIHFEWKPMSFAQNPLDSNIKKQEVEKQKPAPVVEIQQVAIEPELKISESKPEAKVTIKEEKSVPEVKIVQNKIEPVEDIIEVEAEEEIIETVDVEEASNIPDFVNTWQNWLKIDRAETPKAVVVQQPEKTMEKKSEIIDKFIEDNPKISQLKEESQYVVKEKTGDISHLMTETLASLYIEQKLYSKAIKAYEILKKKHPEKLEEFKEKIQEIKELRQNK